MKYLLIALMLAACVTDTTDNTMGVSRGKWGETVSDDLTEYYDVIQIEKSGKSYMIFIDRKLIGKYYDVSDVRTAVYRLDSDEEITLYDGGGCLTWENASVPCIPYKKL